ncbi:MAG: porphobilinogen synthase [Planctomycetota bacterium]
MSFETGRTRPRRRRISPAMRDLVAETRVSRQGLIQPHFVIEGQDRAEEIAAMPGIRRESIDRLARTVGADLELGLNKIILFGVPAKKDALASSSRGEGALVPRAVAELRRRFGQDLFICVDICLCAYTDHGHCGVVRDGRVVNDESLSLLAEMALSCARAGADQVAPSDMMDGRVAAIRDALDEEGLQEVSILSYAVKYASAYYGPFREAASSAPGFGDRRSYQMDYRNHREARSEAEIDVEEGADIIMVKPALAYLDVIADVRQVVDVPVAAYNVSGEYSMVKVAAQQGLIDERAIVIENLTAITRAGADIILTYHARDVYRERWL